MAEEIKKTFTGGKRPVRRAQKPSTGELPASQRKGAAGLSNRAQTEGSRPQRPTANQARPSLKSAGGRPAPKAARSINAGAASAPTSSTTFSSQKPTGRRPVSNQNNSNSNNRGNTGNRTNSRPVNGAPAPAANGAGQFGGALASGNNSARNNTRRRQQGGRVAGGTHTPPSYSYRSNNGPRGSKKAQKIAQNTSAKPATERKEQPLPEVLEFRQGMNVQDLSKLLHRDVAEILKKFFLLGVVVNQNQSLDSEAIELLAVDYGIESKLIEEQNVADIDKFFEDDNVNEDNLVSRPPIVTIMGHVDHGKTTLLDYLRKTHVTDSEAGGITQHIGAYQAMLGDKLITFLDTPGHAAFTEMRARGANVTDITVLVVAADDGIMPQTIEAIDHAKAAGTPIIVAINKIDIPGVNPQGVIDQLMQYELIPEQYGGDTIMVPLSAKTGDNVEQLLEMILLQAEVLDLKADETVNARGSVIEARLDKGRGSVATVLIQQGILKIGDPIVVGNTFGRVRTMADAAGKQLKEAKPATPVEITGLNEVPNAGDRFVVMESEKEAREAGEQRAKEELDKQRNSSKAVTLDTLFSTMADRQMKSVPVIIKADVQGSVEALAGSLRKIEVEGVRVDVIHTGVGAINESDITLAKASDAIVIGFNVRPTTQAKSQAELGEVDVRLYNVIYNAIEDVQSAMEGKLEPIFEEKILGTVEVRQLFHYSKIGTIIGAMVMDGAIKRDSKVRVIRDGVVKFDGQVASLRREKDDVKEVTKGFEFGFTIDGFDGVQEMDTIEVYEMVEVERKSKNNSN